MKMRGGDPVRPRPEAAARTDASADAVVAALRQVSEDLRAVRAAIETGVRRG
jgi:hypothetical protein